MVDQIEEFIIDEMVKAKDEFMSDNENERLIALIKHHSLETVLIELFRLKRRLQ